MARFRSSRGAAFSKYRRTHSKTWRRFKRTQKKRKAFARRVKRIVRSTHHLCQIWTRTSPSSNTTVGSNFAAKGCTFYPYDVLNGVLFQRKYIGTPGISAQSYARIASCNWVPSVSDTATGSVSQVNGIIRTSDTVDLVGWQIDWYVCYTSEEITSGEDPITSIRMLELWPRKNVIPVHNSGYSATPPLNGSVTPYDWQLTGTPVTARGLCINRGVSGTIPDFNWPNPEVVKVKKDKMKWIVLTSDATLEAHIAWTGLKPFAHFRSVKRFKRPMKLTFYDEPLAQQGSIQLAAGSLLTTRLPSFHFVSNEESGTLTSLPYIQGHARFFVRNRDAV